MWYPQQGVLTCTLVVCILKRPELYLWWQSCTLYEKLNKNEPFQRVLNWLLQGTVYKHIFCSPSLTRTHCLETNTKSNYKFYFHISIFPFHWNLKHNVELWLIKYHPVSECHLAGSPFNLLVSVKFILHQLWLCKHESGSHMIEGPAFDHKGPTCLC